MRLCIEYANPGDLKRTRGSSRNSVVIKTFKQRCGEWKLEPWFAFETYSAFVSGVGRSPMVVSVSVDQYRLPRYLRVSVA